MVYTKIKSAAVNYLDNKTTLNVEIYLEAGEFDILKSTVKVTLEGKYDNPYSEEVGALLDDFVARNAAALGLENGMV
jgi:hypothetical protein